MQRNGILFARASEDITQTNPPSWLSLGDAGLVGFRMVTEAPQVS